MQPADPTWQTVILGRLLAAATDADGVFRSPHTLGHWTVENRIYQIARKHRGLSIGTREVEPAPAQSSLSGDTGLVIQYLAGRLTASQLTAATRASRNE
jgi:hypothetical protein